MNIIILPSKIRLKNNKWQIKNRYKTQHDNKRRQRCDFSSLSIESVSASSSLILNIFLQLVFWITSFDFCTKTWMRVWRSSVNQKQRQHGLGPEVQFSLRLHEHTGMS